MSTTHGNPHALDAAIAALESQRALLGDAVVDAALAPLRRERSLLGEAPRAAQQLKQVTVLFSDVVGSTTLSQHLDPEDIHSVMDGALARFTALVREHQGRVLQYAGDSMLAVFGADEAHEDDPERAVRAGLAVLADAREVSADVARRFGHSGFGVRVGISTGPVLLGGGVDEDHTIRGITVNIAARMEQSAPPNQLRISHDTYRHVRGVFDVSEEPPILVKGCDQPLVTYLVQRAKPRAFRLASRGIEGVETRMVGRDDELEQLQDAFKAMFRRQRLQVITVVAEAGIGKSRLLFELESWAEARAERFYNFRGRAQPQTQQQPYGLLRDVLSWRLQIAETDDPATARRKMIEGVGPLLGEDGEAQAHLLGHLIGLDFAASPHVRGLLEDARQIRNRAFHAAAQMLRRLWETEGSPVLLMLDGLQWADDGSLDFIDYLAQVDRDVPALVLALARPSLYDRRPGWGSADTAFSRIDLQPLDKRASRELANVLLQRLDEVPAALRELLISGAEGNPFYMEELVKMLIDEGAIVTRSPDGSDRWHVVPERLVTARVPPTLTGVLQARLDSLPPAEKQALQQASILGYVFWDRALEALDPPSSIMLPALVRRELTVPREAVERDDLREYAFRHQILHQVTYDSVLKRLRREYHARAADWLARLGGDRGAETLGMAAEHYERAGDAANACRFYCRAAENAAARYANEAMLGYVGRALALADPDDHGTRWRLHAVREKYLRFHDDRAAHRADLEAMEALAEALDDDTRRAEVAHCRASTLNHLGDPSAGDAARAALAHATRAGASALAAKIQCTLATSLIRQGEYARARDVAESGLVEARERGDLDGESGLLNAIGLIAMEQGDLMAGAEAFERSLRMEREAGNLRLQGMQLNNLGAIYSLLGDYPAALRHLDEGLRTARAAGRRDNEASVLLNLASVTHLQGDDTRAMAHAHAALDVARAGGQRELEAYAHLVCGHAELGLGRLDAAEQAYRQSRDMILALKMRRQQVFDPITGLARVALARGDLVAGRALAEEILAHLESGGSFDGTEEPLRIPLTCWRVLDALRDPRADTVLAAAHAELQQQARRITHDNARQAFLTNVPHHRAIVAAWAGRQPQREDAVSARPA